MASIVDDSIKQAGFPMTIVRSGGNLSSMFWKGTFNKRGLDPTKSYERFYLIPSDSEIVEGDLVQDANFSYLVMSLSREEEFGEFLCYQGTLYKCNSIVTVRKYDTTTQGFPIFKTGIHCVIMRANRGFIDDDKATAAPSHAGQGNLFLVYAQASTGIDKKCVVTDQNGNDFEVSNDVNPTIANGIVIADAKMVT